MPQARVQLAGIRKSSSTVPKARKVQNGNILSFFKKSPADDPLFMPRKSHDAIANDLNDDIWGEEFSTKRRRMSEELVSRAGATTSLERSSPIGSIPDGNHGSEIGSSDNAKRHSGPSSLKVAQKRRGPFLDESESENEENAIQNNKATGEAPNETNIHNIPESNDYEEAINHEDFEEFKDFGDFGEDDTDQGEEIQEQRWLERQRIVELEQAVFEQFSSQISDTKGDVLCPICSLQLNGFSEEDSSIHVNKCLDGTALPVKESTTPIDISGDSNGGSRFARPSKPAQKDPFAAVGAPGLSDSAFTRLMTGKAEDSAWADAAAAETAMRGRPSYERTCPFYKIIPGFSICVDAFRYGAVEGCQAYFLSHFHSDHYVGLTASWSHGPIYCSRVTANLVRDQLKVDKRWIVPLEFEKEVDIESTPGVVVTMIPANHCPGSSMFLFEKVTGESQRLQRILHCGDFRASKEHITHPLLRADVIDAMTGKKRQQRINTCYLDTTYLDPKYAFPSQNRVIQACSDLCVSLNASPPDDILRHSAVTQNGSGISQFLHPSSTAQPPVTQAAGSSSRLLVVVGTYSIGKERLCVALAHALKTKIYAPSAKQRICACLEDTELSSLLTMDPFAAQVHMAPLFELRADTLAAYLDAQQPPLQPQQQTRLDGRDPAPGHGRFTHAIALRPTGWTYRAPRQGGGGPRAAATPTVSAVLRGTAWKSPFCAADLAPQRGSTARAAIFGVPYSEHSSFRELCAFACALRIDRIVPTVNVGSAKSRERMRWWVDRWAEEKRKNGLLSEHDF